MGVNGLRRYHGRQAIQYNGQGFNWEGGQRFVFPLFYFIFLCVYGGYSRASHDEQTGRSVRTSVAWRCGYCLSCFVFGYTWPGK